MIKHASVTPRLNGTLKDCKSDQPMRPNVSCWTGSIHVTEKAFVEPLKLVLPHLFQSVYQLIQKMKLTHKTKNRKILFSSVEKKKIKTTVVTEKAGYTVRIQH